MKIKRKYIFIVLLLVMVFTFPGVALAKADQYGYDAQARTYKGTLVNWDAFLQGSLPTPFNWNQKDTIFIERKWDKSFDPMVHGNLPLAAGAWEKSKAWEYLSGDQLGWTWHQVLEIVYSPNIPIPGAILIPMEDMGGFTGFYLVEQDEWLTGPNGEKTVLHKN